jgi:hypothetical protein
MTFTQFKGAGEHSGLTANPSVCRTGGIYNRTVRRAIRGFAVLALASFISLAGAAESDPTSVTLTWNPSLDVTVTGYRLYYGAAPEQYTNSIVVGNTTSCTVTGLVNGTTYYFTTTAYNQNGIESLFSNEVSYSLAFSRLQIVAQATQSPVLTIQGVAGRNYEIEATEDLVNWSVIGAVIPNASGVANFTDAAAGSSLRRFYRLRDTTP